MSHAQLHIVHPYNQNPRTVRRYLARHDRNITRTCKAFRTHRVRADRHEMNSLVRSLSFDEDYDEVDTPLPKRPLVDFY